MNTLTTPIQELTADDFDQVIHQSQLPVLVDFWAPWCGPCKTMTPILEAFAEEHSDEISVAKVNVDDAKALATRFGLRSIPTMIFFREGEEVDRLTGAVGKDVLDDHLAKLQV